MPESLRIFAERPPLIDPALQAGHAGREIAIQYVEIVRLRLSENGAISCRKFPTRSMIGDRAFDLVRARFEKKSAPIIPAMPGAASECRS